MGREAACRRDDRRRGSRGAGGGRSDAARDREPRGGRRRTGSRCRRRRRRPARPPSRGSSRSRRTRRSRTARAGAPRSRSSPTTVPARCFRALGPLARDGVNLVQLVSRPLPNSPWRYRFDVVLDGHVFDPTVRPALAELRPMTRELRRVRLVRCRESRNERTTSSARSGTHTSSRRPRARPSLLYVDLHLVHEVTSPQAFEGLRLAGRRVRRPDLTVATMDHNVPTTDGPITDPLARAQLDALQRELRRVRRAALRDRQRARGDRPRDRRGARRHAARHDDRLRRQPHLDARCVRRARVRHRDVGGRARARDADAAAGAAEDDAGRVRRRPAVRAHGEGPRARGDRAARRRRRRRATSSSTPARRSRRSRWKGA